MLVTDSHCMKVFLWWCYQFKINKLNKFLFIIYIIMKNNLLVFNHEIIKLIEIKDMGMLHPGEQP